jgi:solute:Na+ symporter, SSS family
MKDEQIEIAVFVGLLGIMLVIAFLASRWRKPKSLNNLEEWGVGGRAFGNWVTWFLVGGASYTAYTFIAIPAYSWGYGAMGFYAVPFALITAPLVFLISTRFWSVAHAHGFLTSAEFARARFGSRPLGLVVAIVGIVATLPYIAVQLIALEAVFKVIGVEGEWPLLASIAVVSVATFRSGLRAPALLSIAKDILLVWLVLSVVLVVAMSGGWGNAFDAAERSFSVRDKSPTTDILLSSIGPVDLRVPARADRHPGRQGPQHHQAQRGGAADLHLRPRADGDARHLRDREGRAAGRRGPGPWVDRRHQHDHADDLP